MFQQKLTEKKLEDALLLYSLSEYAPLRKRDRAACSDLRPLFPFIVGAKRAQTANSEAGFRTLRTRAQSRALIYSTLFS